MDEQNLYEKAQEEYLKEFPEPICLSCNYYVQNKKCLAFPITGIPSGYMSGRLEHREVVDGQIGAFVFEKRG